MICLIEALNYRCLKYIHQPLDSFHVLVGPNASGKTTFLDVVAFLSQFVSEGPEEAIKTRTNDFRDLVCGRTGNKFELAIEVVIPENLRKKLSDQNCGVVRYEIALGTEDSAEVSILGERVLLQPRAPLTAPQIRPLFPAQDMPPETLQIPRKSGVRPIVKKVPGGNDNFYSEVSDKPGKGWAPSFKLGPRKSALKNLPEDESRFPVSTWLKRFLTDGVQQFVLNSMAIRRASPPGQMRSLKPDGSNLPWVIKGFKKKDPDRFADWLSHLKTALPDITDICIVERPDDRHRYLILCYHNQLEIPSWMASDGTLRLLALTLPAYLSGFEGSYLIEEPENGIHPKAVETMFQSLSSVYSAQIFMATHSPVILGLARADHILCFAKTEEGSTDIVAGSEHPSLKDWRGEVNLGTLFAGGVLG